MVYCGMHVDFSWKGVGNITKTESIIRLILGPTRLDIRSFALAVDRLAELLFIKKIPLDDIQFTRDVYPTVAEQRGKKVAATTRNIERLARECWNGDSEYLERVIGRHIQQPKAPRDMLVYIAFYSFLDTPYYDAMLRFKSSPP